MVKYCLLTFALLIYGLLPAQQFGGHPTRTKWKQINTDTVRVVFPAGYQRQAADIAGIVHRLAQQSTSTLGTDLRKISIVLQPKTTISNGYVGLGPWRSEFYLTSPQNSFSLGSLSWHRTLALHEYRHVQQYNNFRKGISKAFYVLFGQQGLELVNSAAVPNYFWEGDAVYQETSLSEQGRGRLPSFFDGYRSLWSARKNYSWMKLRNGSLRDFVPDHYKLGYMMVAYGREKYGADIWGKITDDAVRYKGLFYPWQKAIKKYTGKDYKTFRREAFEYFKTSLATTTQDSSIDNWARQQRHFAADEEYPQWMDDQTLIFVSNSYMKIPAFYMRNILGGEDEKLRLKDISLDNYFSYRNGKVVYAAYEPDVRWRWKDYSVLKWLDVYTRKQRTLTSKSHYFSPDITEDGNQIVAVQVVPGAPTELHLLNSNDGAVIKKLPNPDQLYYTFPKFYGNGQIVSAVRNPKGAMSLALINTNDGSAEYLLPFSMNVIGFPTIHKDTISFSAAYKGQDRLFMLVDKKLLLFTPPASTASTSHYQLQVAYGRFAWSAFTAAGQHLEQGTLAASQLTPVATGEFAATPANFNVAELEPGKHIPQDAVPADTLLPVTSYSKAHGLFNFHSWRPIVEDPDYTFSIIGENVLNTLQSELYFNYNRDFRYKQIGGRFTYAGLYPWIRVGSVYTIDIPGTTSLASLAGKTLYYNTWDNSVGLQVPLNLTSGRYNRSLTFGSDLVYTKRYFPGTYKDSLDSRAFGYLSNYISFSNQLQQARRHVYPHFAQSIYLNYSRAVINREGNQFVASANWYFPGISKDHSIIINTAFHGRDTSSNINLPTAFPFARGYVGLNLHRMLKFGANYHMGLLYPDWGFANIIYFTRVRANLFYDFVRVQDYNQGRKVEADFRSWGTEVYFDTKWWNQHNVTFGFRYSRLQDLSQLNPSANHWEFIVPINLLGRD
jgi:hypothetical protein